MLEFAWPWLALALPLPLLARLLLSRASEGASLSLRIPFYADVGGRDLDTGAQRRRWLAALGFLAWAALIGAAIRPQWIGSAISIPISGRDLLLAVDISGSMETADLFIRGQPATRLQVVKQVAGDFIERRAGDRVGLILFGRRAYLQTPLTFDRQTTRALLEESAIGLAGKETAIGDAIGLAVKRLREEPEQNRVLILLTDGANTAGAVEPLKAADLAAAEGVKIYTIGVGADEMMVQSLFGSRRVNPSADLDESALTAIAEKTGGRYFRARDTRSLMQIYELLDRLEPAAEEEDVLHPPAELYWWPLAVALALSLLIALAGSRRPRPGTAR